MFTVAAKENTQSNIKHKICDLLQKKHAFLDS